jgi:hypothetical protein
MAGNVKDDEFEHLKKREPEPPFKVGQVVILRRSGKKRDLAAKILEIVKDEDGTEYYRVDGKNCVSASMIRWLTSDEMGW